MSGVDKIEKYGQESLEEVYLKALEAAKRLEDGEILPKTHEYGILHSECLDLFAICASKIENLHLFSSNETADDINTKSLRFLNVDFYIAFIVEKTPIDTSATTLTARISVLKLAARKYCEFAALLTDYDLNPNKFFREILSDSLPSGVRGTLNININRRYDRSEKIATSKLIAHSQKEFESQKNKMRKGCSEESVRNLELIRLQFHLAKAWHAVNNICDELYLLNNIIGSNSDIVLSEQIYIPSPYLTKKALELLLSSSSDGQTYEETRRKMDDRMEQKNIQEDFSTLIEHQFDPNAPKKILGPNGQVYSPFVVVPNGRQDILDNVQGTGQVLPTISIDELVEKELKISGMLDSSQSLSRSNIAKLKRSSFLANSDGETEPEINELTDDKSTIEERKWDEFKDTHYRGAGNTMNLG